MFRDVILAEMERKGISHYALAELVTDRIPRRTVYDYLSGQTDMGGEKVALLAAEIGLSLKRTKQGRK